MAEKLGIGSSFPKLTLNLVNGGKIGVRLFNLRSLF